LAGCSCEKKPDSAPSEALARINADTLARYAQCKKIEKAFPPAPPRPGEPEAEALKRALAYRAEQAKDIAESCGFASGLQYAAFDLRVQVADAERSDDAAVKLPATKAEYLGELEAGWAAELDAGRMDQQDLARRRALIEEVWPGLERSRARLARRGTSTTLEVSVFTDYIPDQSGPLVGRFVQLGKQQPPLDQSERSAVAGWKR
jgi:hypothetical protein